jgi:hypothetical protein
MFGKYNAPSDYDYYDQYLTRGLQRSCSGCDQPVFVDRDEVYVAKVYCERCQEELTALKAAREQRANGDAA